MVEEDGNSQWACPTRLFQAQREEVKWCKSRRSLNESRPSTYSLMLEKGGEEGTPAAKSESMIQIRGSSLCELTENEEEHVENGGN